MLKYQLIITCNYTRQEDIRYNTYTRYTVTLSVEALKISQTCPLLPLVIITSILTKKLLKYFIIKSSESMEALRKDNIFFLYCLTEI